MSRLFASCGQSIGVGLVRAKQLKVRPVKAMDFPVVMYGCEIWSVKKGEPEELMLLNCGVGEDS